MSDKTYNVVIVGAGVAGAIVARQLVESGKSVLLLEAGPGTGLTSGGVRTFVQRFFAELNKVPNSPYPHSLAAPSHSVLDIFNIPGRPPGYLVQTGTIPFGSDYMRTAGGTTLHWLGTCLRMLPNDFRLQRTYGVGRDWPISYDDLRPYYEKAEWEIGVAADIEDQEFPNGGTPMFRQGYQYPMERVPPSYADLVVAEKINGLEVEVSGTVYKLAVKAMPRGANATPRDGVVDPRYPHRGRHLYRPVGAPDDPDEMGQRCQGNASCVPICPVQAKYSALKTLREALDNNEGRLEVVSHAVASEIVIDPASGHVAAIRYKRYINPTDTETTEHLARGTIFVIAAHAIESAKLLLASNVANSSGMVGRNLMDHPYLLTWGLMPQSIGSYRGPGVTSGIQEVRDGLSRSRCSPFIVEIGNDGWMWPKLAPFSTVDQFVDGDKLFGRELRRRLADEGPRHFRLAFGLEQLPDPNNRVTIDSKYMDAIGNYRPVVHYNVSDYSREGAAEASRVSRQIFGKLDVADMTKYEPHHPGYFKREDGLELQIDSPGHMAGTHRMGTSRHDSVVNPDQQTWDHENLYLVGSGNFCTIGTSNPTLTLAALAFKASERIIKALR